MSGRRREGRKKGSQPQESPLLVGTVHRDPLGEARLSALLEKERPAVVTIEVSHYAISFRRSLADRLKCRMREIVWGLGEKGHIDGLASETGGTHGGDVLSLSGVTEVVEMLSLPFEYRTVANYASRHHVPFYCVDLSWVSRERLALLVAEALSEENVLTLLSAQRGDLEEEVGREYREAKRLFGQHGRSGAAGAVTATARLNEMRDRYMHRLIRSLLRPGRDGRLLHVGGWEHLLEGGGRKSLYCLLKDLEPQRILLSDIC